MRGPIWATAVLVMSLAACTAGSGDGDSDGDRKPATPTPVTNKHACGDGTFTWSGIRKTEQLTGVSTARRLIGEPGPDGTELELPMRRVFTPQVSVDAPGPALPSEEILFSLGKRTGEIDSTARTQAEGGTTYPFTQVSRTYPNLPNDPVPVSAAGTFVQFESVVDIQGDFRYTCADGTSVQGHARSWSDGLGGTLNCEEPLDAGGVRAAVARASCEPGSAALKSS